jgi:uncharacterized protein
MQAVVFGTQQGKDYRGYPVPDTGYVTDAAGLLNAMQEEQIETWLYNVEKDTGVEMAVVTISSIGDYFGTADGSIESFAAGLFNSYGIGNMPKNDGVLMLVAVKDRLVRIELGAAYGRRRDGDCQKIINRSILPHFRKNDYAGGITEGTRAMIAEFGGMRFLPGWIRPTILTIIIVLVLVAISLFRSGKRGWGWVVAGTIIVLLLWLFRSGQRTVQALPGSSGDGGGFGVGGFGGGFGGGFSGGGGATGGW